MRTTEPVQGRHGESRDSALARVRLPAASAHAGGGARRQRPGPRARDRRHPLRGRRASGEGFCPIALRVGPDPVGGRLGGARAAARQPARVRVAGSTGRRRSCTRPTPTSRSSRAIAPGSGRASASCWATSRSSTSCSTRPCSRSSRRGSACRCRARWCCARALATLPAAPDLAYPMILKPCTRIDSIWRPLAGRLQGAPARLGGRAARAVAGTLRAGPRRRGAGADRRRRAPDRELPRVRRPGGRGGRRVHRPEAAHDARRVRPDDGAHDHRLG